MTSGREDKYLLSASTNKKDYIQQMAALEEESAPLQLAEECQSARKALNLEDQTDWNDLSDAKDGQTTSERRKRSAQRGLPRSNKYNRGLKGEELVGTYLATPVRRAATSQMRQAGSNTKIGSTPSNLQKISTGYGVRFDS
jgi:hypothetical protein